MSIGVRSAAVAILLSSVSALSSHAADVAKFIPEQRPAVENRDIRWFWNCRVLRGCTAAGGTVQTTIEIPDNPPPGGVGDFLGFEQKNETIDKGEPDIGGGSQIGAPPVPVAQVIVQDVITIPYDITGTSGTGVAEQLLEGVKGATGHAKLPFPEVATTDPVQVGNKWYIKSASVRLEPNVMMPKWTDKLLAKPCLQDAWNEMNEDLNAHEEHHLAIYRKFETLFAEGLKKLPGAASAALAKKQVSDLMKSIFKTLQDESDVFDDKSKNGTLPFEGLEPIEFKLC